MASDTRMALLVMLHPKTVENKEKVRALLFVLCSGHDDAPVRAQKVTAFRLAQEKGRISTFPAKGETRHRAPKAVCSSESWMT